MAGGDRGESPDEVFLDPAVSDVGSAASSILSHRDEFADAEGGEAGNTDSDSHSLSAEIDAALARAGGTTVDPWLAGSGGYSPGGTVVVPRESGSGEGERAIAVGRPFKKQASKSLDELTLQLTLNGSEAVRRSEADRAAFEVQLEQERWQHRISLERERAKNAESLAALRQEMDRKLLTHYDMSKDLQALKKSLADFELSEKNYDELRTRKVEALSLREFILLKTYEKQASLRKQLVQLEREKEAATTDKLDTQLRLERAEAGLARTEQGRLGARNDYERLQKQSSAEIAQLNSELQKLLHSKAATDAKAENLQALHHSAARSEEDVRSLKAERGLLQDNNRQLLLENTRLSEKHHDLELKLALLSNDELPGVRRELHACQMQNEKLEQDLQHATTKLIACREKKDQLAAKVEQEKQQDSYDAQAKVDAQVKSLQERMDADVTKMRGNLMELHAKECSILKERNEHTQREKDSLERKLADVEHEKAELQITLAEVRNRLSNEITELKGMSRLRHFEVEKYSLSYEETLQSLSAATEENGVLKEKVDLLRKEYYELEVRLQKEHSRTQAENVSLKEQLRCYTEMEQELSGALREIAEGGAEAAGGGKMASGDRLGLGSLDKMKTSVEDALLLGTTLAGAPSQARRRIQESLVLAQQLQRKGREVAALRGELEVERGKVQELEKQRALADQSAEWRDEPRHYLVAQLREKEAMVLDLRRSQDLLEKEYEALKEKHLELQERSTEMEADLKSVLTQREQLEFLKQDALPLMNTTTAGRKSKSQSNLPPKVAWFDSLLTAGR
mmetsp:Transcript_25217/g.63471  ORF Transcript_25217/g.63471 Transcript_25217/m.63471 type:complete len:799 (+) Transcript_25217:171-2567(+)